ncbi:hypothetical protein [Pseudomonas sp. S09G 359]|jgi:hypothetical protein|uniref:hypothetical protein n=1 Tax=Pseudomonas sp. S09G 359 TaxID=2054919 RepID=UPI000C6E559A|nr:hypothetical protein [Pseudomonas sp. S09G 359]AUG07963.1 hypothetical protein CXQ82_15735 [Pseudomonas sp. S09G 359]
MKTLLIAGVLTVLSTLFIGYYDALEDGDINAVFFIKKYPTFQMRFYNIHANDGEIRQVEDLTGEERKLILDYCRYRLGIDTQLKTQSDIETCRKK